MQAKIKLVYSKKSSQSSYVAPSTANIIKEYIWDGNLPQKLTALEKDHDILEFNLLPPVAVDLLPVAELLVKIARRIRVTLPTPEAEIMVVKAILSNKSLLEQLKDSELNFSTIQFAVKKNYQKVLTIDLKDPLLLVKLSETIASMITEDLYENNLILSLPDGQNEGLQPLLNLLRHRVFSSKIKVQIGTKEQVAIQKILSSIEERNEALLSSKKIKLLNLGAEKKSDPELVLNMPFVTEEDTLAISSFYENFNLLTKISLISPETIAMGFFSAFKNQNKLLSLDLHYCSLSEANTQELLMLIATTPNIQTLTFRNVNINLDYLFQGLAGISGEISLKKIEIYGTKKALVISPVHAILALVKLKSGSITLKDSDAYSYRDVLISFSSQDIDLSTFKIDTESLLIIVKALRANYELKKLNLSGKKINQAIMVELAQCLNNSHSLEELSLDNCECSNDLLDDFFTLFNRPKLRVLSLNNIIFDFPALFQRMQDLSCPLPEYALINDIGFYNALALLQLVEELEQESQSSVNLIDLSQLHFEILFCQGSYRVIIDRLFMALMHKPEIQKIDFTKACFDSVSLAYVLGCINKLNHIDIIDFGQAIFKETGCEKLLADLLKQKNLKQLNLVASNIVANRLLDELLNSDYSHLTTIKTSNSQEDKKITKNFETLMALNQCQSQINQVKTLKLHNLCNALLPRLCQVISQAKNLFELDLSNTYTPEQYYYYQTISDDQQLLKAIIANSNLRSLNLSGLHLTDKSMEFIAGYLSLAACQLHVLILKDCSIGFNGFKILCDALAKNKSLVSLDISYNNAIMDHLEELALVLANNKTLTQLCALEKIPPQSGNEFKKANASQNNKNILEKLKPHITRIEAFVETLKTGSRPNSSSMSNTGKKKKLKKEKYTALLSVVLYAKRELLDLITSTAAEKKAVQSLSAVVEVNSKNRLNSFAEVSKNLPDIDKLKDFLMNERALSPYAVNDNGDTILHVATRNNNPEVIALYFRAYRQWSIDLEIPNAKGETCLSIAAGNPELLDLLSNPNKATFTEVASAHVVKAQSPKPATNAGAAAASSAVAPSLPPASKKHGLPATDEQAASKKPHTDLSEASPMDIDDIHTELHELIKRRFESSETLIEIRRLLENGANFLLNDKCPLVLAIEFRMYRLTKLLIRHGFDINRLMSNGNCPLLMAAAHNVRPIFELLLNHPSLNELSVRKTQEYCLAYSAKNPFLEYYLQRCEARLNVHFLKVNNVQWLSDMEVVYGSKIPEKVIKIPSYKNHIELFFKNSYTKDVLSRRLDAEDESQKAGGNPVTCYLTFIISDHHKIRHSVRVSLDPAKVPLFHVAQNSNGEAIDRGALRKVMQERSESGLARVIDKELFVNQSFFVEPGTIINEDDLDDVTFCYRFHHGEQSLISALEDDQVINYLCSQLFNAKEFTWGAKILGVVLDLCSPNYVCSNCTLAILSVQSPGNSTFLDKLSALLKANDCKLPALSPIKMITRVGSYKAFERSEPVSLKEHLQICIDMRLTANNIILQQDMVSTAEKAAEFHSTSK